MAIQEEFISLAGLLGQNEYRSRLIEKLRRELGPVCDFLADPEVIEIMLNPDGILRVERFGQRIEPVGTMSAAEAESFMTTVAAYYRTTITREQPILAVPLPLDGSRLEAMIEPVVKAPIFAIRKKASKVFKLSEYVAAESMTESQKHILEGAVEQRKNILVSGGTGTGKTTLVNAIIACIVEKTPEHRLVIIEDTAEIQCAAEDAVLLQTTETIDMLRLLRETMRLRPDRILVGEVRGGEALSMLKAWNTGHPGGVATIHANNALAGLTRLEQLIAETGSNPIPALIAEAVDIVVSIVKTSKGPAIREIIAVEGFDGHQYIVNSLE